MNITAIIPARGASKRIPRKNVLPLAGIPVVAHSILHARESELVQEVVVSTDDDEIAAIAERYGAVVVRRPEDLAGDTATSESALLHALDARRAAGRPDPDLVVFLQCTSPLRRRGEIDAAIRTFHEKKADSLLSAVEDFGLLWREDAHGHLSSANWDYRTRKREQEMGRQFRENGSLYIFSPARLRAEGNRLAGKIAIHEMDFLSSFQLDAPEHYELLKVLARRPEFAHDTIWPERVDLVVFDFDGVMTDNTVTVNGEGVEQVTCDRGDGWGIGRLRDAGIEAIVLSTEPNPVVAARSRKLSLQCHHDIADKGEYLRRLLAERKIDPSHVVYVGNDVNDLDCLKLVGLAVVVADARPEAVEESDLVLSRKGGHGAVREICDLILERYASNA